MTMMACSWNVDPGDPRAPTQEVWDRMSPEERAYVIASLPSEFPLSAVPEGDPHFEAKVGARDALRGYFDRIGRRVYLACELPVYYPGERMFAPDVIAVLDVERKQRMSFVVAAEGKGIDLAIEVHVAGDRRKDLERNKARYARLGIREYFIFDRGRLHLTGYRKDDNSPVYRPIVPQGGLYASQILGLELGVKDERIRFFHGTAQVPEAEELVTQLRQMMEQVEAHRAEEERQREQIERRLEEETRLREEETRLREEETRLRGEAERKLAEALAEIDHLRRERSS